MPERIYLDHAATSPLRPEAKAAMEEGFRIWANPSSPHAEGRKARAALEDARERIKAALGWEGELIFTSGASEALAIGLGRAKVDRRIVSAVEHDAVFRAAPDAEVVPVGEHGSVNADRLESGLDRPGRAVVVIQTVNPETGTRVLGEGPGQTHSLVKLVRDKGSLVLADCSQSAGKLPIPDVDLAVISAHKFGGPIGIGALLLRDFADLEPFGGHERGYRAGTENMPAALAMAVVLESVDRAHWANSADDRSHFRQGLFDGGEIQMPGVQQDYIFSITSQHLSAHAALIRLDAMGFAVSAGSACSSGSLKPSRVLKAFGIDDETAARTIRVSIGWSTTPEELDAFADAWKNLNQ